MNEEDYRAAVLARASNQFHPGLIPAGPLIDILNAMSTAGKYLDVFKKSLFYGKVLPDTPPGGFVPEGTLIPWAEFGNPELLHALLGIMSEAGELAEALLPHIVNDTPLDYTNLREELGDINWFRVLALTNLGETEATNRAQNEAKLAARFGAAFSSEAALNRDLNAERQVLEK